MKFTVTFEISPSGPFGLPEQGVTVVPPGTGYTGAPIHTPSLRAGRFVTPGYGTLPNYRDERDRISTAVDLGSVKGHITDNFAFLDVEADNDSQAFRSAEAARSRFLQNLSVSSGFLFQARALIIESDDGRVYALPTSVELGQFKTYNLGRLVQDIAEAQKCALLKDERLEKALDYFEHALWLHGQISKLKLIFSRHYTFIISSLFLNLWKCITTIVGDPSRRKDCYQRRYREIGLPDSYKAELDKLKLMRDDYDVAHYKLNDESSSQLRGKFGKAFGIASEVIKQYRLHLLHVGARDGTLSLLNEHQDGPQSNA